MGMFDFLSKKEPKKDKVEEKEKDNLSLSGFPKPQYEVTDEPLPVQMEKLVDMFNSGAPKVTLIGRGTRMSRSVDLTAIICRKHTDPRPERVVDPSGKTLLIMEHDKNMTDVLSKLKANIVAESISNASTETGSIILLGKGFSSKDGKMNVLITILATR